MVFIKPQIPPSSGYTWHNVACIPGDLRSSPFFTSTCSEMAFPFFPHLLKPRACWLLCALLPPGVRELKRKDGWMLPSHLGWTWSVVLAFQG